MPGQVLVSFSIVVLATAALSTHVSTVYAEAPAGFDTLTNGMMSQAAFDEARHAFEERETIENGLGPRYNAQSCATCHINPITGGASQVAEVRVGRLDVFGAFIAPAGGSLIHDLAIAPAIQAHISDDDRLRSLRVTPAVLGLGYVECIEDSSLRQIAQAQAMQTGGRIAGEIVEVPVLEAAGSFRVGRFGWKNHHASLLSFAAEAYVNELGITNRLATSEVGITGDAAAVYDVVPDPEDNAGNAAGEQGIDALAAFMRATKVPSRDPILAATPVVRAGAQLFREIGCAMCHVETHVTAAAGTFINGGTFLVPAALGSKTIHPFSDFLLHDIGTGDGVPQGDASGRVFRTAPLWGLRTRTRLMHDGLSLTPLEAIRRHRGEALEASRAVRRSTGDQLRQLLVFLGSL